MRKSYYALVIVIVILGGVLLFAKSGSKQSELPAGNITPPPVISIKEENTSPPPAQAIVPPSTQKPTPPPAPVEGRFSGEEDIAVNPDTQVYEVVYDGTSFKPASITIKVGDIVFFKNESKVSFEPASAPHPAHTAYPEFDAKNPIAAGNMFDFKFTKIGTWKYHDHLNPSATGTIVVTN